MTKPDSLSPVSGEFRERGLERKFRCAQTSTELTRLRWIWIFALIFFLAYGPADILLFNPADPFQLLGPRIVILLVGGLALVLTLWSWGIRRRDAIGCLTLLVVALCYGSLMRARGVHGQMSGAVFLLVIGSYVFSPTRFAMACLNGAGFSLAAVWGLKSLPSDLQLFTQSYLLPANLLAATVLAQLNRRSRQAWFRQIQLAEEVSQRKQAELDLATSHKRAQDLLYNTLPAQVARQLQESPSRELVRHCSQATVLFADLVDFSSLSMRLPPQDLLNVLNQLFSRFDMLAKEHGLEKIKTVGDAYMAVAGVTGIAQGQQARAARMALSQLQYCDALARQISLPLQLRIGVHCGPLVAGVIGCTRLSFDVWGPTVNISSRLQTAASPGRILVSSAVRQACQNYFLFSAPRLQTLRGCGPVAACNLYLEKSGQIAGNQARHGFG